MAEKVTHAIFDFGGAIIDLAKVIEDILSEYAINYDRQSSQIVIGRIREASSFNVMCEEICKHFDLKVEGNPIYTDLDVVKKNILKWLREKSIRMQSGAQKMIEHLYQNNVQMAITTNLDSRVFEILLERTEGFDEKYFSHFVCGASDPEVKANKPAPDLYLVCAKRFNDPPKSLDNCVIFEDTMRGVTSAVATGMKTAIITDKTVIELGAIADKITRIIRSFNNFCPESMGLPPIQ